MVYDRIDAINGEPPYDNYGFQCLPISGEVKNIHNSLNTNEITFSTLVTENGPPKMILS